MKRKLDRTDKLFSILAEFNDELGPLLSKSRGDCTVKVMKLIVEYADKIVLLYHPEDWRAVSGKPLNGLPFELQMLGVSLLVSAWTGWIFNLKARDRKRVGMLNTYMMFKADLLYLLTKIEFDTWKKIDPVAEGMYIAELVRWNQQEHLKDLGVIPSLRYRIKKKLGVR